MIKNEANSNTPKIISHSIGNHIPRYDTYSCPYCSVLPEILYFNEINNSIKFKCKKHGENTLLIQDYLDKMINWVNISEIKSKNKCINHNDIYSYYCKNCEENICQKCLNETKKHEEHIKYNIVELNPNKNELLLLKEKLSIWIKKREELNDQIINLNNKIIFFDILINTYEKHTSNYLLNINLKHLLQGEKINPDLLKNAQFIKLQTEKTFLEDFIENKFVNYTNNPHELNLSNIGIDNQLLNIIIKGIEDNTVQRILKLSGKIKTPKELVDLRSIKILNLRGNKISNINFLSNKIFPSLEILTLNDNEINSIDIFKTVSFPMLKELYLTKNFISNIDILKEMNIPKLQILWLSHNKITSIDVLQNVKFPQLLKLGLNKNKIKDIGVFGKKKARFPQLFELYIHGNDFDSKAFFEIIKSLYNRIKEFYY